MSTITTPPSFITKRLKGKVAIVTASTEGIGYAIALRLGQEGAHVVVSSRRQKNVTEAKESLEKAGISVLALICHVADANHRKNLIEKTLQQFGRIDFLISNAAVSPTVAPLQDIEEAAWDKLFEINVKAGFLLTKEVVPHMIKVGGGSIIYISSIGGYVVEGPLSAYGITKTTLLGLTRAFASELGPLGIRVNCVAPGLVKTRFSEVLWKTEEVLAKSLEQIPLGRLGEPADIAGPVAFLCSDDSSWITGETIVVAGGVRSRL